MNTSNTFQHITRLKYAYQKQNNITVDLKIVCFILFRV